MARLDCHHPQHVRHRPPLSSRPWVLTAEGREAHLGVELDCVRCDAFEWPDGLACYRATADFTDATVPAGLRRAHTTKVGVWGRIVVAEGAVVYVARGRRWRLTPGDAGAHGVIVPGMHHHVEPEPGARFRVEFWRPVS